MHLRFFSVEKRILHIVCGLVFHIVDIYPYDFGVLLICLLHYPRLVREGNRFLIVILVVLLLVIAVSLLAVVIVLVVGLLLLILLYRLCMLRYLFEAGFWGLW